MCVPLVALPAASGYACMHVDSKTVLKIFGRILNCMDFYSSIKFPGIILNYFHADFISTFCLPPTEANTTNDLHKYIGFKLQSSISSFQEISRFLDTLLARRRL
jgi:hypothetical protein